MMKTASHSPPLRLWLAPRCAAVGVWWKTRDSIPERKEHRMPMQDWIHKYPKVQALLQHAGDVLDYDVDMTGDCSHCGYSHWGVRSCPLCGTTHLSAPQIAHIGTLHLSPCATDRLCTLLNLGWFDSERQDRSEDENACPLHDTAVTFEEALAQGLLAAGDNPTLARWSGAGGLPRIGY